MTFTESFSVIGLAINTGSNVDNMAIYLNDTVYRNCTGSGMAILLFVEGVGQNLIVVKGLTFDSIISAYIKSPPIVGCLFHLKDFGLSDF